MTTALFRSGGSMLFDTSGKPLAGGRLYYYQAGTTNPASTYMDAAGSILNTNPVILNASGQLAQPVYFGSAYSYKELLTDAYGATISPWPFDNLPAASGAASAQTGFERLYLPWVQLTSASSPKTLGLTDAGTGYECDCTSGAITINLPAASLSGITGTGFFFKKTDSGTHALTVTPAGTDNLDGANASVSTTAQNAEIYVISDGAQWLIFNNYNWMPLLLGEIAQPAAPAAGNVQLYGYTGDYIASQTPGGVQRIYGKPPSVQFAIGSSSGTMTPTSGTVRWRVRMSAGGATGWDAGSSTGGTGTFLGSWTAIGGGAPTSASPGIGGTGGVNSTGTLILRVAGGDGGGGVAVSAAIGATGGAGGVNPLGGSGAGGVFGVNSGHPASPLGKSGTGAGGGGQGSPSSGTAAYPGGGAGEYVEFYIQNPSAMSYSVGGNGGLYIEEFYS